MNRKQLYNEINALDLKHEVHATYGKNYTNCSNDELKAVLNKVKDSCEATKKCSPAFSKLVEILAKKRILLKSEVNAIMKA